MENTNVFKIDYNNKTKKIYVTNTRFMGVVGVVVYYDKFVDIYHLDFEEYGIDGFYRVDIINEEEITNRINEIIGGLGGKLKKINENQFKFLIKEAFNISDVYFEIYDILDQSYNEILNLNITLDEEEFKNLNEKMCVKLRNDYELINYYLMRIIANDKISNLLDLKDINFEITKNSFTLLKNDIKKGEDNCYLCESLIDFENKYRLINTKLKIENKKIIEADVIEKLDLSSIEAALILNRKEYIVTYYVNDKKIEDEFYKENSKTMKNSYKNGNLFTEYNSNNNHVMKKTYFLNEDIYGIYYFTNSNQLVISSFKEKNIDEIINKLKKYQNLELNGDFIVDKSLIYSFITSEYNDFYKFLHLERED